MSIKSLIADAYSKVSALVTDDRELSVIAAPYPPLVPQKVRPFRQKFTDNGLASGNDDMSVDGSSVSVDYFIDADQSNDRYITTINFIVGYGTSGQPNEWGDGSQLANGVRIFYTSTLGEVDVHDGIKSNQDFFRLSFAPVPTAWEVRHVNALNDFGYFITLDLTKLGFPFGIKLDRGTKQSLTISIRDNVAADVDSFNAIAYGIDRFE